MNHYNRNQCSNEHNYNLDIHEKFQNPRNMNGKGRVPDHKKQEEHLHREEKVRRESREYREIEEMQNNRMNFNNIIYLNSNYNR